MGLINLGLFGVHHQPEPQGLRPHAGVILPPEVRPTIDPRHVEAAAAKNLVTASIGAKRVGGRSVGVGAEAVLADLQDVAVHVEETPPVRLLAGHLVGVEAPGLPVDVLELLGVLRVGTPLRTR